MQCLKTNQRKSVKGSKKTTKTPQLVVNLVRPSTELTMPMAQQ